MKIQQIIGSCQIIIYIVIVTGVFLDAFLANMKEMYESTTSPMNQPDNEIAQTEKIFIYKICWNISMQMQT